MILDKQEAFVTVSTALETLGGHESGVSDYVDFGAANALDGHKKMYLNIAGIADLEASGSETITIALVSDTNPNFATAKKTEFTSGAIAKGSVAAYRKKIQIPEGMYRYVRIEWTISGTSTGGGTFKAFRSES